MILVLAGLAEVVCTVSLKTTHGFSNLWWTVSALVSGAAAFVLMGLALKSLPVGPAYAVWTGIGIAGSMLVGAIWLSDGFNWPTLAGVGMIFVGVLTLYLVRPPLA